MGRDGCTSQNRQPGRLVLKGRSILYPQQAHQQTNRRILHPRRFLPNPNLPLDFATKLAEHLRREAQTARPVELF